MNFSSIDSSFAIESKVSQSSILKPVMFEHDPLVQLNETERFGSTYMAYGAVGRTATTKQDLSSQQAEISSTSAFTELSTRPRKHRDP